MNSYFCNQMDGYYECSAFQPAYEKGESSGYPRFGIEESEAGRLWYTMLKWTTDPAESYEWVIEGATALATGIAVAASILTTF